MAGVGIPNASAGSSGVKVPRPGAGHPPPAAGGHGAPHQNLARAAAVRAGHPHGAGHGSAQPYNWLQPLSPQQVQAQAIATVRAAYKPATQVLDQQSAQAQAILAKQEADNQYYQQWLDSKTAALQAQQNQVEQSTNALEQQLTGNQLHQFSGQADTLIGQANARAGNVSNNAQSNAFGAELAQNQAAMESALGGAAQRTLAQENISQTQLGAATANTGAFLQAGAQKQSAAFNDTMTKIANARSLLSSKEGADLQKEIARLQGVQINLASSNRNYATAAEKLGISLANTQSQIASRDAATKLAQAKFQQTQNQDSFNNWYKHQTLSLDQKKFAQQLVNDNFLNAQRAAQTAKDKNGGSLTQHERTTLYMAIDKATGELNGLIGQGMDPHVAYQALLNGGYVINGKHYNVPRMSDQSMLNAAFHLAQGQTGLTSGDLTYLSSKLGLTDASTYYSGRIAGSGSSGGGPFGLKGLF